MGKNYREVMRTWRANNQDLVDRYKRSIEGRYTQLRRAAKRAGRSLDIALEMYRAMVEPDRCFYCSGPLSAYGYSIDRLDHTKGYEVGNSVPCCGVRNGSRNRSCNFRKGHLESIGFFYPRTVELLLELLQKEK